MLDNIDETVPALPPKSTLLIKTSVSAGAIVLLMIAVSAWASQYLPVDSRYPVHWNLAGQVDRYGSKFEVLWLLPLVGLVIGLLASLLPLIVPRSDSLLRSRKPYLLVITGTLMMLLLVHCALIATAMGFKVNVSRIVGVGMGVLFVIIGNVFGKIRSNFLMGIRTPWTLSSELSWNKTHRLGGRCFVALGLMASVCALLAPIPYVVGSWLSVVPVAIALAAYSYVIWKSDPNRLIS